MKDVSDDLVLSETSVEEIELVEFGDATAVTMGPNFGSWIDPGGWPKPFG